MHAHHRSLLVAHLNMSEPFASPAAGCQGVRLTSTLASLRSMRMPKIRSIPSQWPQMTATHSLCTIVDTV